MLNPLQEKILSELIALGGKAEWTKILNRLPPETNSLEAWQELERMEAHRLLWVENHITKIPGQATAVHVPFLRIQPQE